MTHLSQEYHDYMQSDRWQQKRKLVLARDKYTCQRCGRKGYDVHHMTYKRFGDERLTDLETLCRSCHNAEHRNTNILIDACQTCGQILLILVQKMKGGWTRLTCSDGHVREYRKGRKR